MTNQFTELLSTIKDYERRLSNLESFNQTKRIANANGTIIDETGLVSTNNFIHAQVFNGAAGLSTPSISFVDVAGSSLSSIVLTRSAKVLVYMMSHGYNSNAISSDLTHNMEVRLYDSFLNGALANTITFGSTATRLWVDGGGFLNWSSTVANQMVYELAVLTMAAGTHNLKLQYKAVNGGTAYLNAWLAGYIILGK